MKKVEILETVTIVAAPGSIVICSEKQADLLRGKVKEAKEQKKEKEPKNKKGKE